MAAEYRGVPNYHHPEMQQMISELRTSDGYSFRKVKRTGDRKFVDWCLDMLRMHSQTVYVLNFRIGYCTTINQVTTLYLLSVWDLIERLNITMPTKGSCLNLITSRSNVRTLTLITVPKAVFLLFLYYTCAGLHGIGSSNMRSYCPLGKRYLPFSRGAKILHNWFYIPKLKNMQR